MAETPLPTGTVTFLFSDIEESTELVRSLGNEVFSKLRGNHRRLLRDAFRAHDGLEIDTAGDGFFVAFDSAREAVEAAIEGQRALAAEQWPGDAALRVRMGLHTAEPHLGEEGTSASASIARRGSATRLAAARSSSRTRPQASSRMRSSPAFASSTSGSTG
jgi:class 3 adenylate cyclase